MISGYRVRPATNASRGLVLLIAILVPFSAARARAASASQAKSTESAASLRRAVALQLALDRHGFSPGLIDGIIGPKVTQALKEFQAARGLRVTGTADEATSGALGVDERTAFVRYTITAEDKSSVGPLPSGWVEKSKARRLPYPNLAEAVAERFHAHRNLLARINPHAPLSSWSVGTVVVVPNAQEVAQPPRAARLEVDLRNKTIRAYSARRELVGLFHCSIPAQEKKRPSGRAEVIAVVENPTYGFDPEMWPEVKGVYQKLTIPYGPRNPVGVRWIGLSLPGVGIHGTPNPELIGKTGSHGCIRLTNWDAVRLAKMVSPGTPVEFIGAKSGLAAAAPR